MEANECAEMIRRHPELILVSNSPITWDGMLNVPINSIQKSKVRLKLTLPDFPLFNGASLKFGRNSAALLNRDFDKKLINLLKNAASVTSFLKQLQILIGETLRRKASGLTRIDDYSVISELEAVMYSPCEVRLSSSYGLNLVELVYNDILLKLQRDANCSDTWKIVSCDLAQLQGSELVVGTTISLKDAASKLEKQVESLENVWEHLRDIDRNCWVIDPLVPKPHHLYRRIKVTESLSVLISINRSQPSSLPAIRILGSDSEVLKYREIISDNFELWDPNNTTSENLLLLLNLQEFPKISNAKEEKRKDNGLFNDEECGICFSLELNEDELPDRICDNEKCRKHFHNACLLQWLQAIPGNQVVFNQLYGACPFCGQNIPCPIE